MQDIRFAIRQWRKAPGFAAIASLTSGARRKRDDGDFTVVNGVVLRPPPYGRPEQIVQVWGIDSKGGPPRFADPTFDHLAAENRSLQVPRIR